MIKNRELLEQTYFNVSTEPIYATSESGLVVQIPGIENYKAVVKSDNRQVLGITTQKYGLLKNSDAFEMIFRAIDDLGIDGVVTDMSVTKNQARVRATIQFPEILCDPGDGHNLAYRCIVQNGYDGKFNFGFMQGCYRLVCTNGMIIGTTVEEFVSRHTINIEETFQQVIERFKTILPQASSIIANNTYKLIHTTNTHRTDQVADVVTILSNLPVKYRKEFDEKIDSPRAPYWDIYNAFTDVISHDDRQRSGFRRDQLLGNLHSSFEKVMKMNEDQFQEIRNQALAA